MRASVPSRKFLALFAWPRRRRLRSSSLEHSRSSVVEAPCRRGRSLTGIVKKLLTRGTGAGWVLALALTPCVAQQVPATTEGHWAAGGDLGWAFPLGNDHFDGAFSLDGFIEYRQTSTLSWRGMLWYTSFGGDREDVGLIAVNGNVIYEWEARKARPFLTAGIGLYDYRPQGHSSSLEFGVDFGAGVNVPVGKQVDLKFEGVFHGTTGTEPDSFLLLSVGARYRF